VIFQAALMEKVLAGTKIETRRPATALADGSVKPCFYKAGRRYPLQPGRTKKAIGHVWVTSARLERCGDITAEAARAEGFTGEEPTAEFLAYVAALWRCSPEEAAGRQVWAIRFTPPDPA